MTDTFNVTGTITPANPTTGQAITVTITGDDVLTTTQQGTIGPLTGQLLAADGATSTVTIAAVPFTLVTSTPESVKLTGITDPSGRLWTVAANGLSATAVA